MPARRRKAQDSPNARRITKGAGAQIGPSVYAHKGKKERAAQRASRNWYSAIGMRERELVARAYYRWPLSNAIFASPPPIAQPIREILGKGETGGSTSPSVCGGARGDKSEITRRRCYTPDAWRSQDLGKAALDYAESARNIFLPGKYARKKRCAPRE